MNINLEANEMVAEHAAHIGYRTIGARHGLCHEGPRRDTWTARAVRALASDEVYVGAKGYPAIVDPRRFERAQVAISRMDPAAIQRRKGGRPASDDYLLREPGGPGRGAARLLPVVQG